MNNTQTAIVVIGFNRVKPLERLLKSISSANYLVRNIPLIISIDYANNNEEVLKVADNFEWKFGTKKVIKHKVNLGLRKHVILCGDMSKEYESIIMLEDDLFVSPNFYTYSLIALNFSKNKPYLGGISLYNHRLNVHTNEIFQPIEDEYDNYYLQFASSWGQAWNKDQWKSFKLWYSKKSELLPKNNIPKNITDWSEKSWLKYFTAYLIDEDKYFLYPRVSLSTNFSEAGTHIDSNSTIFQVPLSYAKKYSVNLCGFEESLSVYDAFYENTRLYKHLNLHSKDLCVDLYGYRSSANKKYWITSQAKNFKILKTFGRSLKPIESNIIENISGADLILYDTTIQEKNKLKPNKFKRISYSIGQLSVKNSALITIELLRSKLKGKFG